MKKLLWVLILLLLPLTALAEDAESRRDGAFFYQIADGEATLTGCDWDAMQADSLYMFAEPPVSLEIPATLGGYPVTSIGGGVFCSLDGCPVDAPFEVVLPEGLRTLDAYTFTECFYATKITLPASLEIIPEGCFDRVPAEIDFPNGNPRYSCENGFLINNTPRRRATASRCPPSAALATGRFPTITSGTTIMTPFSPTRWKALAVTSSMTAA